MAAETADPPSCPRKCGKCHPGNPRETEAWQKDIRKDKTKDKRERQGRIIFQRGWRGHILDTSWTPKKTRIFSQDTPSRWRRTRTAAPGVVEVASGSSRVPADKSEAPHRGEGSLEQRTKRNISKHVIFYYSYGPLPVISTYNPIYRMYNHV